jgi:hypothetical protein
VSPRVRLRIALLARAPNLFCSLVQELRPLLGVELPTVIADELDRLPRDVLAWWIVWARRLRAQYD